MPINETNRTCATEAEAAALMLGYLLGRSKHIDCFIDPELPNVVLIDLKNDQAIRDHREAIINDELHSKWLEQIARSRDNASD